MGWVIPHPPLSLCPCALQVELGEYFFWGGHWFGATQDSPNHLGLMLFPGNAPLSATHPLGTHPWGHKGGFQGSSEGRAWGDV